MPSSTWLGLGHRLWLHVHGMCTACARHVHGMCTACARHVHGTCTACAWHVHSSTHLLVADEVVAHAEGGMHASLHQRRLDPRAGLGSAAEVLAPRLGLGLGPGLGGGVRVAEARAGLEPEPESQVVHEPAPADREERKVDLSVAGWGLVRL
eukprot:scaffold45349_cov68-Phaeocystis_antarctica.AAC.1